MNVPSPARFALHKLVIAQRRPAARQTKSKKDILQAETLLRVILEDRPGDLWVAFDAAAKMPVKFQNQLQQGQLKLDKEIQSELPAK